MSGRHGGPRPGAGRKPKVLGAVAIKATLPGEVAARYVEEAGRRGSTAAEVLREVAVDHAPRP